MKKSTIKKLSYTTTIRDHKGKHLYTCQACKLTFMKSVELAKHRRWPCAVPSTSSEPKVFTQHWPDSPDLILEQNQIR